MADRQSEEVGRNVAEFIYYSLHDLCFIGALVMYHSLSLLSCLPAAGHQPNHYMITMRKSTPPL